MAAAQDRVAAGADGAACALPSPTERGLSSQSRGRGPPLPAGLRCCLPPACPQQPVLLKVTQLFQAWALPGEGLVGLPPASCPPRLWPPAPWRPPPLGSASHRLLGDGD